MQQGPCCCGRSLRGAEACSTHCVHLEAAMYIHMYLERERKCVGGGRSGGDGVFRSTTPTWSQCRGPIECYALVGRCSRWVGRERGSREERAEELRQLCIHRQSDSSTEMNIATGNGSIHRFIVGGSQFGNADFPAGILPSADVTPSEITRSPSRHGLPTLDRRLWREQLAKT